MGLNRIGFVPYSLRHAGASADYLNRLRTIQEVQFRGRWRTERSLKRYCKSSLAQAAAAEVPAAVLKFGNDVEANLTRFFDGSMIVPRPPVCP